MCTNVNTFAVSIPYRYSNNCWKYSKCRYTWRVSIPYRYSNNAAVFESLDVLPSWFQFLIGILITQKVGFGENRYQLFQFLIGILITKSF